jgi:cobalt-zinc-cadmium efflux system protein
MESAPRGLDVGRLIADVEAVPGVVAMHDVHVWSLAAHLPALSAHVRVEDDSHPRCDQILVEIQQLLTGRYGIAHNTLQLECEESTVACASGTDGPGCTPRRH